MLFKAAVVTLWTLVEYCVAIPATPVSLQCSSGFSAGGSCPTAPLWLRHCQVGEIRRTAVMEDLVHQRCILEDNAELDR